MENTMGVARALDNLYYEKNGKHMDEMRMHKLMYFAQRESLMYNKEPLFDATFYGWKYGPVLKEVRNQFKKDLNLEELTKLKDSVSDNTKKILESVFDRYGSLSSWKLSALSHEEFSWKMARSGLNYEDNGNVPLSLNAMKVDAQRELVSRRRAA
jgi:gp27